MAIPIALVSLAWVAAAVFAVAKPSRFPQGFPRDLLAVAGFAVLVCGFFVQVLFLTDYLVPRGGGDLASFLYPVYSFAARNIQNGTIPLWNPYHFGGMPFAADMQTGIFYPINFIAFVLVRPFTYDAMEGLAILHYFLASVFMYIYLRSLGIGRLGSFAAGLSFAFCGFAVAHLGHLNMLASVVWLPLILYFFHKAFTRGSITSAIAAGAAYGVSILAGHVQMTLYLGLFIALYWLWGHISGWWSKGALRPRWLGSRCTASLPVTMLVAFGLAAIQLLPSAELTNLSIRANISYAQSTEYAVTPLGLVTLIVPHFLGPDSTDFWGIKGNLTEVYGYAGILVMLLAVLALVVRSRTLSWRWFFAIASVLFLLLSLGQDTILQGWLYRFVPGFDKVRAPGRFLFFFDFGVAILAGFGLDALTRPLARRDRPPLKIVIWISAAAVALASIGSLLFLQALLNSQDKDPAIFQRIQSATSGMATTLVFLLVGLVLLLLHRYRGRWRAMIPWIAIAVIVVDLFSAGWMYNTTPQNILEGFNQPQVIRFLQADEDNFRIDSATNVYDAWQPGTNLNNLIGDVQGLFNPMMLADFSAYWNSMGSRSSSSYDLLNAKYIVAHKDVVLDWSKYKPVLTDAPKVNVYQNTKATPRAMIIPSARVAPRDSILDLLRAPDFNPSATIFLEDGQARNPTSIDFPRQVLSVSYPNPNRVVIVAETAEPAYLFLADVMYPGWKARLDGQETPVRRADYLFRAVDLPAGRHTVEFSFEPRTWTLGWITSLVFLLGIIAAFPTAWFWKRTRS
ncbi:MAG: YfhO family protein [Dehalococcoidia bacterium]|nr:YfhO family protein [Dehalococcoidia bacterium]